MAGPDDEQHLSTDDARDGAELGIMRYVLGISLALVVVIFLLLIWHPFW